MSLVSCPLAATRLLVEGGGDDLPPSALIQFVSWCGGFATRGTASDSDNPYVVLIPWPSSCDATEVLDYYKSDHWFGGSIDLKIAQSVEEIEADATWTDFKDLVMGSVGVWISGGDQNRICDLFSKKEGMKEFLQAEYITGKPFGGTSAGASIMSETMLTGEGANGNAESETGSLWNFITPGKVGIRSGLGLVNNMVIDQHFLIRSRNNRLLSVLSEPDCAERFGIGIDEDCAVLITDNHLLEVIGAADKVVLLLQRVGTSRDTYITRILHACPNIGQGRVIDLLTLPNYDEDPYESTVFTQRNDD